MQFRKTIIQRALELAAGGGCTTVTQIKERLKREGYQGAAANLDREEIRRLLRALMAEAATRA